MLTAGSWPSCGTWAPVVTSGGGRLAWLLAGLASTITAIAGAGTSLWYLTSVQQHLHTQRHSASYATPAQITLQLSAGDITVTSGPAGSIQVTDQLQWSGIRPVLHQRWQGRALIITADCASGFADSCTARYTLKVPPGVPLNLATDSGDITATGTGSPELRASTASGDVWLRFAAAPYTVWASSDSGNVTVLVPPGTGYTVNPQSVDGSADIKVGSDPATHRSITVLSDDGNIAVNYD